MDNPLPSKEQTIQRMARAICNAWASSPGCLADEAGKSPCTAKNCSIYTVAVHALQELGELPPECECPAPGTSNSSWSPFCRVHASSHEPKSDQCEVCRKPLPPVGAWSMPSCPDCQEVLGFLGELQADFAERDRTQKAEMVGNAIRLICSRTAPPPRNVQGAIFDRLGWICSVCHGWNHHQDVHCTHTHSGSVSTKEAG
jgi:hypothetical protein